MADNMDLWNAVCTTNPDYTKKVNQRGGFTDISPMHRYEIMTQALGPVGIGWGFDVAWRYVGTGHDTVIVAEVTIWLQDRANTFGPISSGDRLYEERQDNAGNITYKFDDEAWKKACTDALGKGLSMAGVCADVYLGRFDGSKYRENHAQSQPRGQQRRTAPRPRDRDMEDGTRRRLHELGQLAYGENWDAKRAELTESITRGRSTSASDLKENEAQMMIRGIENKLDGRPDDE
jgi:hypothetical protein